MSFHEVYHVVDSSLHRRLAAVVRGPLRPGAQPLLAVVPPRRATAQAGQRWTGHVKLLSGEREDAWPWVKCSEYLQNWGWLEYVG